MRRTAFLLLVGAILSGLIVFSAPATGRADPAEPEIEQLREQIADLQQRVAALEQRLAERRSRSRRAEPPSLVRPRDGLRPRQVPPGWRRREFNGVPYYIIPIEQQSRSRTARPSRKR